MGALCAGSLRFSRQQVGGAKECESPVPTPRASDSALQSSLITSPTVAYPKDLDEPARSAGDLLPRTFAENPTEKLCKRLRNAGQNSSRRRPYMVYC